MKSEDGRFQVILINIFLIPITKQQKSFDNKSLYEFKY